MACGYVGEASVWAWLGVQCGGVASVWAWLVGSVWAVPQCCPAVLIGVEVVGGRGLWGVWAWPRCGPGFRCSVGVWSDVGVACGCVGVASVWVWLEMQCEGVVRCSMGVA